MIEPVSPPRHYCKHIAQHIIRFEKESWAGNFDEMQKRGHCGVSVVYTLWDLMTDEEKMSADKTQDLLFPFMQCSDQCPPHNPGPREHRSIKKKSKLNNDVKLNTDDENVKNHKDIFMNFMSLLDKMPEFLSSHDLVGLGLFPSTDSVYFARRRGNSPDFIKMGRKVIYPKASVVKFLEECLQKGGIAKGI